jgi:predicted amidophosphoribosyltransferase
MWLSMEGGEIMPTPGLVIIIGIIVFLIWLMSRKKDNVKKCPNCQSWVKFRTSDNFCIRCGHEWPKDEK